MHLRAPHPDPLKSRAKQPMNRICDALSWARHRLVSDDPNHRLQSSIRTDTSLIHDTQVAWQTIIKCMDGHTIAFSLTILTIAFNGPSAAAHNLQTSLPPTQVTWCIVRVGAGKGESGACMALHGLPLVVPPSLVAPLGCPRSIESCF